MRFLVASMDSGRTFAPDGKEFENMQILGFVDANSIIEARQKFITENLELLTHGYGSEWDLKFYSCEDTAYPEESENFFEYSLSNNEMHFWGNTIGFFSVPLNKDILSLLEENGIEENEPIEFFDETVKLLYHQVMKQRFHSRQM